MAVIKNMMVRAGADFSAFTTQAKKASSSMRGMQSNVTSSCSIMKRSLSGVSKSCSAVKTAISGVKGALGAIAAVVSVAAIVSATKSAVEAYDKQAEAEIKLATVMRNTMGARNAEIQSVLDLCSAQQKLGVIGDEAQLAGAQELSKYLQLSSSLKRLIPVMNDMAAQQHGFNVTAENCTSIATVLGKAMSGQTTILRRYGFTLTSAQEALLKTGDEEERAALLADIVSQRVGGMNRVLAQTPSGRMQQLSNAIGDVKEQFGEAARTVGVLFLPVLWQAADILAIVAGWATRAASAVASVFGAASSLTGWQNIGAGVGSLGEDFSDLGESVSGAGSAASEAKRKMLGFDELNVLGSSKGGGGGGSSSGIGSLGGNSPLSEETGARAGVSAFISQLKEAVQLSDWEGLGRILGNKVNEIFSKLDLKKAGKSLGKKIDGVIRTAFSFLKTINFKNIAGKVAGFFNGIFSEVDFESAGGLFVRKFTAILDLFIGFINGLDWGEVATAIGDFFKGAFREVADWLKNTDIGEVARNLSSGIIKILDALIEAAREIPWSEVGEAIGEFLSNIDWVGILERAAELIFNVAKGVLEGLLGTSGGRMFVAVLAAVKGLKLAFTSAVPHVLDGVSSFVTSISNGVGSLASKISSHAPAIGKAALGVFDAVLIAYDVKALSDAASTYEAAQDAHAHQTEVYLNSYTKLYREKGKEVADQWALMVEGINTTNMSFEEAQQALVERVEHEWDGVPQNMWQGFKAGWNQYFGEGGSGLLSLMGDAFNGAVRGIKNMLGIHSPSKVFGELGENTGLGFFEKLKDVWSDLVSWASKAGLSLTNNLFNSVQTGIPDMVQGAGNIASALEMSIKPGILNPDGIAGRNKTQGSTAAAFDNGSTSLDGLLQTLLNLFDWLRNEGRQNHVTMIDGRAVFETVIEENNRAIRRTGASPIRV